MARALRGRVSNIETDSADVSPPCTPLAQLSNQPIRDDEDFRAFIHFMPHELQERNIDALIICSPKDNIEAEGFANHLFNDIKYTYCNQTVCPEVKLTWGIHGDGCDTLDNLIKRTTFVFLFFTESFFQEDWSELVSNACMCKAIARNSKKNTVIPVLNDPNDAYSLPLLLRCVKPINYFKVDKFYIGALEYMFRKQASERIKRDVKLNEDRKGYFHEHKNELRSMRELTHSEQNTHCSTAVHGVYNSANEYQRVTRRNTQPSVEVDGPVQRGTRHQVQSTAPVRDIVESNHTAHDSMTSLSSYSHDSLSSNENNEFSTSLAFSTDTDSCAGQPAASNRDHSVTSVWDTSIGGNSNIDHVALRQERQCVASANVQHSSIGGNSNTDHVALCQERQCVASPNVQHSQDSSQGSSVSDKFACVSSKSTADQKAAQTVTHVHNHYHINRAGNVIIGDQGTINVNNENCGEEDCSSSDAEDGDFEIVRPPPLHANTSGQRRSACNTIDSHLSRDENVPGALPDLMNPVVGSYRQPEESESSSVHFVSDADETCVKYSA